jgi:hypothetical protein
VSDLKSEILEEVESSSRRPAWESYSLPCSPGWTAQLIPVPGMSYLQRTSGFQKMLMHNSRKKGSEEGL